MKKLFLLISFSLSLNGVHAVQPCSISFSASFEGQQIHLGKYYPLSGNDSIRFDIFRFYISSVCFFKYDTCIYREPESFHLIDLLDTTSMRLTMDIPEKSSFNFIRFNLGIDSITNNAGAMGGDLDPTKGMYWTWQSGYINFKLEGVSSRCTSRNNEFQFHLGGYSFPYNSLREIVIETRNTNAVSIDIDIKKFIDTLNFSEQTNIMSPGNEAMNLSTIAAGCFKGKSQ